MTTESRLWDGHWPTMYDWLYPPWPHRGRAQSHAMTLDNALTLVTHDNQTLVVRVGETVRVNVLPASPALDVETLSNALDGFEHCDDEWYRAKDALILAADAQGEARGRQEIERLRESAKFQADILTETEAQLAEQAITIQALRKEIAGLDPDDN